MNFTFRLPRTINGRTDARNALPQAVARAVPGPAGPGWGGRAWDDPHADASAAPVTRVRMDLCNEWLYLNAHAKLLLLFFFNRSRCPTIITHDPSAITTLVIFAW